MSSSANLLNAFNTAIVDIETETRILKQIANLRFTAHNSTPEVTTTLTEIDDIVSRLEHRSWRALIVQRP